MKEICQVCGRSYKGDQCLSCTQQAIDMTDFGAETLGSTVASGVSGTIAIDDSMAKLRLTSTDQPFVVVKPVCRLGQDPSNDIILSSDPLIAKFHAQIVLENNAYTLRDLGTKEGTWLNGERIVIDANLFDGDQMKIGSYTFNFTSDMKEFE